MCAAASEAAPWRHRFHALGGPCALWLDDAQPPATLRAAAAAAEAEVRRIEALWSRYRPDSVVSRINAAAGSGRPVPVDEETAALLRFAHTLHEESGGRFDLTAGALRRAWDFRSGRLPDAAALAAALACVGWQGLRHDAQGVQLLRPGMELDLGGLGKEYAADRAATLLQARGLSQGGVDLAGDIRLLGPRRDGRPWRLGVRHPRQPGALLATLELAEGALATSGDYERCIVHQGRRYGHILDPRSGWPAMHWQSVSVVAPTCTAAGALCTVAMLGGEETPEWLRAQGVRFVAVDTRGQRHG